MLFCLYSKHSYFKRFGEDNPLVYYVSIALLCMGFIIMRLQRKSGPRMCFKKFFVINEWNYFWKLYDLKEEEREQVCPVCYMTLKDQIDDEEIHLPDILQNLNEIDRKKYQVMKTPCNHFFHVSCLVSCMMYKKKCAVCRFDLPDWTH